MSVKPKRMLVMSDIHGCYDEFDMMLKEVGYAPEFDQLILLGDYVDRGRRSKDVIEKIIDLVNSHGAIVLRGNHDQMFYDWLTTNDGMNEFNFFRNGGIQTVESYCGLDWFELGNTYQQAKKFVLDNYQHHLDFLSNLPFFYETDEFVFVHAGLNPLYENWRLTPHEDMIWIRDIFHHNPTQTDKTVVFGHTPCVKLHGNADIWFGGDKIGIDGAVAYGYQLNCLEITEDGFTQYWIDSKYKPTI